MSTHTYTHIKCVFMLVSSLTLVKTMQTAFDPKLDFRISYIIRVSKVVAQMTLLKKKVLKS